MSSLSEIEKSILVSILDNPNLLDSPLLKPEYFNTPEGYQFLEHASGLFHEKGKLDTKMLEQAFPDIMEQLKGASKPKNISDALDKMVQQYVKDRTLALGELLQNHSLNNMNHQNDFLASVASQIHDLQARLSGRGDRLSDRITTWIEGISSEFTVGQLDSELSLTSKQEKNNRRQILNRLTKSGKLVRVAAGKFRTIHTPEVIDFLNVDSEKSIIDLKLPFGLHHLFKLFPKSIIVVAGEPNQGKTAFLAETAVLNLDLKPKYFSSEMSAEEFKVRFKSFEDMAPLTKIAAKMQAHYLDDDYHQYIDPNGINIIDYLEIDDLFYLVGEKIKLIHQTLNTGVAVVAIQKKPKSAMGLGGMFSMQKPRVYLSLAPGVLTLLKIKNRNPGPDPNNQRIFFDFNDEGRLFEKRRTWILSPQQRGGDYELPE